VTDRLPDRTAWAEPLLTAKQLAEALGFTRRQVYELVAGSGLPAYKLGRSLRFELSAVTAWLEKRRIGDWDQNGAPDGSVLVDGGRA
jgi:excisionase family DNA binding protein